MIGYFFFFQAEDGIRDDLVTGVQTCALPIWKASGVDEVTAEMIKRGGESLKRWMWSMCVKVFEIGRASCRERV